MVVLIARESTFEAAHRLDEMPDGHKCRRLHGHSYRILTSVAGEPDARTGLFLDFAELDRFVHEEVIEHCDHNFLNEVEGLSNPTLENIARWAFHRIAKRLPQQATMRSVVIHEGPRSVAEYTGGRGW